MRLTRWARRLLLLEPLLWAVMLYALWWPEPSRVFALVLILPILLLRALANAALPRTPWRSLIAGTPMLPLLIAFFALCLFNIAAAPYRWGIVTAVLGPIRLQMEYGFVFLSRPLLGAFILLSLGGYVRQHQHARTTSDKSGWPVLGRIIAGAVAMVIVLTVFGLFATVWSEKSIDFQPLLAYIPRLTGIAAVEGGFNVNEIGGALATVTPLITGLAIAAWRWPQRRNELRRENEPDHQAPRHHAPRLWQVVRWGLTLLAAVLLIALFLGQSRSAIIGVIVALALVIALLVPRGRLMVAAYLVLGLYTGVEGVVISKVLSPTRDALILRDEDSLSGRRAIWESGLHILSDYPLTGVGINTFRHPEVRARYPVPGYETQVLPHAHNEWLQVGTDLGLPGMIVFTGFYALAGLMAWRCWRSGDAWARALAVSAAAGLLAHAIFGLADANALWDRLTFVFWWALGLIAASHATLPSAQPLPEAAPVTQPAARLPALKT